MFSFEDLEKIRQAMAQLGIGVTTEADEAADAAEKNNKQRKHPKTDPAPDGGNTAEDCFHLNPSQLLIIAGFLTGALQVESVLVNRNQSIEIVLTGNLKRKTQLDKVMEQVGKMPFDRVVKAIMENSQGF